MNQIDLHGRCAVVTGGGQGIGLAIAARLIASGATVCLWDRDPVPLAEATKALGTAASGIEVDVADPDRVDRAAADTHDRLGKIDILVNNAGIAGPNAPVWEISPAAWRECIDIDLGGVFPIIHDGHRISAGRAVATGLTAIFETDCRRGWRLLFGARPAAPAAWFRALGR